MTIAQLLVNSAIKTITRTACKVDDAALARVPMRGPLILAANHVNFLDIPLLYTHLLPRKIYALVKEETWDNPVMGKLFDMWNGIPIKRGENDMVAFSRARQVLAEGHILAISPEGTRTRTGILQPAHVGLAILAQKSQAPILPLAIYGGEVIWDNLHHLERTAFHIRVGPQLFLKPGIEITDRQIRQDVADQVMYQIAALLPERYRGVYSDLSRQHLRYFDSAAS
jgi:1-acyl-sn-glycerol-3-phosphate acyltransferase